MLYIALCSLLSLINDVLVKIRILRLQHIRYIYIYKYIYIYIYIYIYDDDDDNRLWAKISIPVNF